MLVPLARAAPLARPGQCRGRAQIVCRPPSEIDLRAAVGVAGATHSARRAAEPGGVAQVSERVAAGTRSQQSAVGSQQSAVSTRKRPSGAFTCCCCCSSSRLAKRENAQLKRGDDCTRLHNRRRLRLGLVSLFTLHGQRCRLSAVGCRPAQCAPRSVCPAHGAGAGKVGKAGKGARCTKAGGEGRARAARRC